MNASRSKHLTIRSLPGDLVQALEKERTRLGLSLNETVKALLRRALGLKEPSYDNGLGKHAGSWSAADLRAFEASTACFEEVDEDLWR